MRRRGERGGNSLLKCEKHGFLKRCFLFSLPLPRSGFIRLSGIYHKPYVISYLLKTTYFYSSSSNRKCLGTSGRFRLASELRLHCNSKRLAAHCACDFETRERASTFASLVWCAFFVCRRPNFLERRPGALHEA